MMRKAVHILGVAATIAMGAAFASVAQAADNTAIGNGGLVRGGAALPLPSFTPNFPIELTPPPSTEPTPSENLEISLTAPDHSVLRFLFSPRLVSGETSGFGSMVTGSYAGLAWNIFDNDRLFGSVGLTGAVNRQALEDPTHRLYGPLLSLHSTFELGYSLSAQQSLSLSLDHGTPSPYYGNDLRLRYGYHF